VDVDVDAGAGLGGRPDVENRDPDETGVVVALEPEEKCDDAATDALLDVVRVPDVGVDCADAKRLVIALCLIERVVLLPRVILPPWAVLSPPNSGFGGSLYGTLAPRTSPNSSSKFQSTICSIPHGGLSTGGFSRSLT
jgi:hypothetical protein